MSTTSNSSLMKKTKAELVNIILRKDAVHVELNEKVASLEKERDESYISNKKLNEKVVSLELENKKLNKINNGFKEALDEDAIIMQQSNKNLAFWRNVAIIEAAVLVILVVIAIL